MYAALNQGAILQAYALQRTLEYLGHEAEFIRIARNYTLKKTWRSFFAKSPLKTVNKITDQYNAWKYERLSSWNSMLRLGSDKYRSDNDLMANPPEYDAYIVGSDQVWHFTDKLYPAYLLDFAPSDKPRIAYAASMGQLGDIPRYLYDPLKKALEQFSAISLREDSGVSFVKELLGRTDIEKTLDPTLLIDIDDYQGIAAPVAHESYDIISYLLQSPDPYQLGYLKNFAAQHNLSITNLRNPNSCIRISSVENRIVTPRQWISYIKNAAFILSGSFHATVFALIFHRPFLVVRPQSMKSIGDLRIKSLLQAFDLEDRLVYGHEVDRLELLYGQPINWNDVDFKIQALRANSLKFLQRNLKN